MISLDAFKTRKRIAIEEHQSVFNWVLGVLDKAGLIKGKTIGIDATTLEANAAMRSIVRRDDGQSYHEFLTDLAKSSGIETPMREDLARIDRKRKKKGSNQDWCNPLPSRWAWPSLRSNIERCPAPPALLRIVRVGGDARSAFWRWCPAEKRPGTLRSRTAAPATTVWE